MRGSEKDEAESGRIIRRVGQETEASMAGRAARRARDHLAADDKADEEWAEVWGTRIGRIAGLVIFVGLVIWLVFFVIPST